MKKYFLFKSLMDVFLFLHVIGLVGILVQSYFEFYASTTPLWLNLILLIVRAGCYLVFLRGLYLFRKLSRAFLSNNLFDGNHVINLRKSGVCFIYAGVVSFSLFLCGRIFDFDGNVLLKTLSIAPLFLIVVGMFFIILSKALKIGMGLKTENDLII